MKNFYLVRYKIYDLQTVFSTLNSVEEWLVPVFSDTPEGAVRKLKNNLENEKKIGKRTGRTLEVLSLTKAIL